MSRMIHEIEQAALMPITVDEAGGLFWKIRLPEGFIGFSGHFPGYPLVPAVVQVLIAQHVAAQSVPAGLGLKGVEQAKFLHQIRPGHEIAVHCRLKPQGDELRVEARLNCADVLAASFVLKYAQERLER